MRLTRVYVDAPLASGMRVTLQGGAAGHLTRVLRLRVGEALTVFNGAGGEYAASIEHAHAGRVAVAIGELRAIERESPLTLTLAQGVSRGERMDLVVQKATELGASGLAPVLAERSVVRLTAQQAERRLNHWPASRPDATGCRRSRHPCRSRTSCAPATAACACCSHPQPRQRSPTCHAW